MQEVRQVPHCMERAIGDRPSVVQDLRRSTRGFDCTLCDRELHLDGGQGLPDFVVQLARHDAPLFFLGSNQLRR